MDKERIKKANEIQAKIIKEGRFKDFTVSQIENVAFAMAEEHEKGYADGYREGVIDYRKAASNVRDDERGN